MRGLRDLLAALARPSTWRLALRNVARNRRRTGIVLTAVAVGLAGMLLAMAVNYGMIFQMIETAIRSELGHVQVHARGWSERPAVDVRLPARAVAAALEEGVPGLEAWAPRVRGQGLVYSPRAGVGVRVVGVDPRREADVTSLADSIVAGSPLDGGRRRLLVGERLARRLEVEVGDKVVVSAQDVAGDLTAGAFRVGGLFRTASRELDESVVYLPLARAQSLFGLEGAVSELVLVAPSERGTDALRDAVAERLAARLPPGTGVEVETWKEVRPFLQQMIDVFEQTGWVVYAAIFVAMAFGIANVLLMSVFERIREIGILMAIGMPPGRMVAIVVLESLVLTLLGAALGMAGGIGGVLALGDGIDLSRWGEGLVSLGIPTRIVPVLPRGDLFTPVGIAFATALLASLWPAVRAVRIVPAEAVRHV